MTQTNEPVGEYSGEYSGAALQAFINGVSLQFVLTNILRQHGLDSIDPEHWYDFELARSLYQTIGRKVGASTLLRVGSGIIDAAEFPPSINDPHSALASIEHAYRHSVRGEGLGEIRYQRMDERCAELTFTTPFPCVLDQGIMQGCCEKYGAAPKIDHTSESCRDRGDPSCSYTVSW